MAAPTLESRPTYSLLEVSGGKVRLPLVGEDVTMDDEECTMVVIFPLSTKQSEHGTIDCDAIKEEPLHCVEKIFLRTDNEESAKVVDKAAKLWNSGKPVSMREFHEFVRREFLEILRNIGVAVTQFDSIDGDEFFVKLSINRNGDVIKYMAQQCEYRMPYTDEAYKRYLPTVGDFPKVPLENDYGDKVYLFDSYDITKETNFKAFQGFSELDEIRILAFNLDRWFLLDEMKLQGVISQFFPLSHPTSLVDLIENWGGSWCEFPNQKDLPQVKEHFGEEIAYFVHWHTFYIRFLVPLALVGLGSWLWFRHEHTNEDPRHAAVTRVAFTCFLSFWAASCCQIYTSSSCRYKQVWGSDSNHYETERADWEPRSSVQLWRGCSISQGLAQTLANVTVCIYVALIGGLVFFTMWLQAYRAGLGHHDPPVIYSTAASCIITGFNSIWGTFAKKLVDLQNHRTHERWSVQMTYILSSVKILVAMWPFVLALFVNRYAFTTCGETFDAAASSVWGTEKFGSPKDWPPAQKQLMVEGFGFVNSQKQTCILGCYPENPLTATMYTYSVCYEKAKDSLNTFFWIQAFSQLASLVVPIVLTRNTVQQEISKAQKKKDDSGAPAAYSWIQFQAKCDAVAPYEYGGGGGSYIEDFNAEVIGFALVVCFSNLCPLLPLFALITGAVSYRLRAFRFTFVNGRPFPRASNGIGNWEDLLSTLCVVGAIVNSATIVFISPFLHWSLAARLALFIGIVGGCLLLRNLADIIIPAVSTDVVQCSDHNDRLRRRLKARVEPQGELPRNQSVNLSLTETAAERAQALRAAV